MTTLKKKLKALSKQKIIYTIAYPPQSYKCKYIDLNKSKPFVSPNGQLENRIGLPFCTKTQDYISDKDEFMHFVMSLDVDEYIVTCKNCKLELAKYFVEKNTKGSQDGILGLQFTQHLMSYRPRTDGLLGLECICGSGDTRLSDDERSKNPDKFPKIDPSSSFNKAKFNDRAGKFISIKKLI